jgi:hypothetical protein
MNKLAWVLFGACLASVGCGGPDHINDLPLVWAGAEKSPPPSSSVDKAFGTVPIEIGEFKDARSGDKSKVGTYAENGFVVKTKGDVRAFWAGRMRIMLESAGAKLGAPAPQSRLDAELLDFDVLEDNMFNATVRMRITVTRKDGAQPAWTATYEGKSKRWGRSHSPDNFDEALSNAMFEAAKRLLQDDAFARALLGQPAASKPAGSGSAGVAL